MANFRMTRVTIDQFAILAEKTTDFSQWKVDISFRYGYSPSGKYLDMKSKYVFYSPEEKWIILDLTCRFTFDSDDEFVKDDAIVIPKEVLLNLGVHCIGTARGIVVCKTEGTALSAVILPPIDLNQIIKEDFKVR